MAVMRETEAARPYGRQSVDVRAFRRQEEKKTNGLDGAGEMGKEGEKGGRKEKERRRGEVKIENRTCSLWNDVILILWGVT